eukprot:g6782.t1
MLSDSVAAVVLAGLFSLASITISLNQILLHLRFYTEPLFQRYIVRIIFMVPVYSLASFLSLLFHSQHIYFDTIRDLYEAWILYNFLGLCLAYVGGPGEVVVKCEGRTLEPNWLCCTCCLPRAPINGQFLRRCKQGVLQFVLVKPLLAIITLTLYNSKDGDQRAYEEALYALIVFYQGTEPLLAPFKPLLKFVLIKAVVFLTFWQGLVIALLASWGTFSSGSAKDLQNFLICVEMLFAAILLLFAFPYKEYRVAGMDARLGAGNVRHAISIRDVVSDTVHQFAPQYHDYVLYSDDTTEKPVKTVRARTFVKMGQETTRYHDNSTLLTSVDPPPIQQFQNGTEMVTVTEQQDESTNRDEETMV